MVRFRIAKNTPPVIQCIILGCAIYNVAGDILATAEGGEEIGEIVADAFVGA